MHPRLILSRKLRHDFQAADARRQAAAGDPNVDWSRRQLDAVRLRWEDAIADLPHYADLVSSGRAPREIRSWEDFRSIPILTRQDIQDQPARFLRRSRRPEGFVTTAGSTGTPLRLGMDQECRDLMRIVKLAAWMDLGYTPTSRLFLIWGHAHLLGTGWKGRLNGLRRKLADRFLGYQRVDAYRLDRASCLAYAERLVRFRPIGIIGYASALDLFARYTSAFRERFRGLGLRFALATAEPMPQPDTQELLEDHFNCPVVQEYGGAEYGQVAFKAGAEPFKTYSDLVHLECEPPDPQSPGVHPALATLLYPRYVPLFRYRIGDGLLGPETLPHGHVARFAGVAGRLNDEIKLADGSSIHSVAIFHCIHQEPSVLNIQMLLNDDAIEIRLVTSTGADAAVERRIRQRLAQVHPLLGEARITFAEDLVTSRAGKRRWFIDNRKPAPVGTPGRREQ